jgi:hypothetical protein
VADTGIDLNKLLTELLELAKFFDLSLRFPLMLRVGQRFGDRFASDLEGDAEVGAVGWLAGLMAMTI